jgi:hypothetical protein
VLRIVCFLLICWWNILDIGLVGFVSLFHFFRIVLSESCWITSCY